MKKIKLIVFILIPVAIFSQQNLPVNFTKYSIKKVFDTIAYKKQILKLFNGLHQQDSLMFNEAFKKDISKKDFESIPVIKDFEGLGMKDKLEVMDSLHFSLYGIGNLNDETLKNLNAGGKIAVGFTPKPNSDKLHATYFASFNKNASNTDSAISTMLVFPEAGNHTAFLSALWRKEKPVDGEKGLIFQSGPFLEFAFKKVTNKKDTTDPKFQELSINTLHYTAGYRFGYSKIKSIEGKTYEVGGYFSLFASYVNIPDEDHENFQKITRLSATKNDFFMIGGKVSFELNGFQIFADIRHVFGDEKKLPVKDLKGFNSNIGVAFNTEIFRF